ncbi:MAG: hypothetical protein LBF54_02790 [Holosporaceae bacterium]|jgi:F0F1-type ATP synthase delta subunit|nr:hypothetical protein [Holosporaceae bacterium]
MEKQNSQEYEYKTDLLDESQQVINDFSCLYNTLVLSAAFNHEDRRKMVNEFFSKHSGKLEEIGEI